MIIPDLLRSSPLRKHPEIDRLARLLLPPLAPNHQPRHQSFSPIVALALEQSAKAFEFDAEAFEAAGDLMASPQPAPLGLRKIGLRLRQPRPLMRGFAHVSLAAPTLRQRAMMLHGAARAVLKIKAAFFAFNHLAFGKLIDGARRAAEELGEGGGGDGFGH